MIRLLHLLVGLTLFWSAPAAAATYTATASRDSMLKELASNENNGTLTEPLIKNSGGTDRHRAIFGFTLPTIPSGEIITSATVDFWVTQSDSQAVSVRRVTDSWTENGVTWGNTGTDIAGTDEGSFTPASTGRYYSVTVTSLVRGWYDGTFANNGVMLLGPSGIDVKVTSREWSTSTQRPRLVITTAPIPPLTVVKSSQAYFDPYNGTTNAKLIPEGFVAYTVQVSNSGTHTIQNNSIVITDPTPAGLRLFVGTVPGGSGPVLFTGGSSGLAYTYTSLASTTDDVDFSNNGGSTWTYTPVPDADQVDPNVTNIRIRPRGTMAASSSFNVLFGYQIQ
jgi:trimeric autotransporter adhesin